MKISLLQLLAVIITLQLSWSAPLKAQLMDKRISVEFNDQKLEDAINTVANQGSFRLVYSNQFRNKKTLINASFRETAIKDILDKLLSANDLSYDVLNDQFIVIKAKLSADKRRVDSDNSSVNVAKRVPFVVTGTVTDENEMPMLGVSVRIKNENRVVFTDAKGKYEITITLPGSILEFSYVGYRTAEQTVTSPTELNVKLKLDLAKLDEVVILGYGTTTKRTTTGAQVGITAKDIEKQPVTNLLQTIQGRLAGVQVTQTNGLPGAGINVQIRGANSLGKSNRPLYIIDGVPFLSEPINTSTGTANVLPSAEGNTSPINTINPADIESIDILKDADATAIYGSRAANGVVLITTKKGKSGKTKFRMNASSGASEVTRFVEMLSTSEYLALRRKGFANLTTSPTAPNNTNAPDLLLWDQNTSTNWQKELIGGTARTHDLNANISGGDIRTNFYLSGTYHKEGNVYPGEQGYQRGGMNVNLNHTSANQRFTLGFSGIYSIDENKISTLELSSIAYLLPPNYPIYKPDGSLYWVTGLSNPYGFLNQTNENTSSNLLSNLSLKYNLLKGLDVKSTFGYSKVDMKQVTLRPLTSLNSATSTPTTGTAAYAYVYTNNYIVEPQITYVSKIWKGNLNVLAGGTYQVRDSQQPYYTLGSGFASDDFLRNVSQATTSSTRSSSSGFKYASLFGRINYNLQSKYILNLNFRRDGSSRFGPNNKFGNFGSVGAAWIFSEERLIKDNEKWLSFGKLRGSYGIVGNDEIGDYQYLESYSASSASFNGSSSLVPTRIANSNFKWESTKKLELALELGFFNDRLSLTGSYYNNKSGNQLITFLLSSQTGFSGYQSNLPAVVQNEGIELSISSTNFKTKNFSWMSNFNISRNSNKLLSFTDIEKSAYYASYIIGNPISSIYAYQFIGIDPATNLPAFADLNATGGTATPTTGLAIIGRGDRYFLGANYPKFFGGLTNSLSYKNFTLDFTFQFVKQQGRSLATSTTNPPGYITNAAASLVENYLSLGSQDYLVTSGTATVNGLAAQRAYNFWANSDANVVDASFIRMKNVSLNYSLPATWLSKIHVDNVRVFVQGQNMFTITGYKGIDPESQGLVTPPLRTIIAGLQLTF